ncbi:MAG: hypothetical protein WD013_03445, partial [Gemmatimonadota bacterium]
MNESSTAAAPATPTPGAPPASEHLHPIVRALIEAPAMGSLRSNVPRAGQRAQIGGIVGAGGSAVVATLTEIHSNRIFVVVTTDPESAARMEADLETLLGSGVPHLYPQHEARFYSEDSDPRIDGLRVEAVEALLGGEGKVFVTTPRALQERMAMPDRLALLHLELALEEEVGLSLLAEQLETMGYERVPLVEQVGQFAVRGGLVDIFSLGLADPVRIEFWGDRISSIRSFEVSDQRSTGELDSVRLLPASFRSGEDSGSTSLRSFLEVLPTDTVLVRTDGTDWEEAFPK